MANKKKNSNRIMITLSDEALNRLEAINDRFGISKSMQIQTLILKYTEMEFGQISKQRILSYGTRDPYEE